MTINLIVSRGGPLIDWVPGSNLTLPSASLALATTAPTATIGGGGTSYATLDPAHAGSGGTLSNGNLTFTYATAAANARATTSHSSGKFYFEFTVGSSAATAYSVEVGICNSSQSMTSGQLGATADAGGIFIGDDNFYINGAGQQLFFGTDGGLHAGKTYGVAIDVANKIWITDGVHWDELSSDTHDPATGVGGIDISGVSTPQFIAVHVEANTNATVTLNFGATTYAYTPPSGFNNLW